MEKGHVPCSDWLWCNCYAFHFAGGGGGSHGVADVYHHAGSSVAVAVVALASALVAGVLGMILLCWAHPGGSAWGANYYYYALFCLKCSSSRIPGPRGIPLLGSMLGMGSGRAHRRLASLALRHCAQPLLALSLGSTRVVVAGRPETARELLCGASFADRPLLPSARLLGFQRAIGFAPHGEHWRRLRHLSAAHLFSPRAVAARAPQRHAELAAMLSAMSTELAGKPGVLQPRLFLRRASINSILSVVFGRRFGFSPVATPDQTTAEAKELEDMITQGFELMGSFNHSDYLPFFFQTGFLNRRSRSLVTRVNTWVQTSIDQHRNTNKKKEKNENNNNNNDDDDNKNKNKNKIPEIPDFVDVLLSLQEAEKLTDPDMVAILWEMVFRGTDTVAILVEWTLAELVLNPSVQDKLRLEIETACGECGPGNTTDDDVSDLQIGRMDYLKAVVKEVLRLHPPGPLLSWARMATQDATLGGHMVPKGTTAMVNMWAISRDPSSWTDPGQFKPERHLDPPASGSDDMCLAPFGAGKRACPGKALGLATVYLWVARLVRHFYWEVAPKHPVDLTEILKLSSEMLNPLHARIVPIHTVP